MQYRFLKSKKNFHNENFLIHVLFGYEKNIFYHHHRLLDIYSGRVFVSDEAYTEIDQNLLVSGVRRFGGSDIYYISDT